MYWVTWLLCNGYGWRVKAGVRRRCKKVRVIVIYRFPLRPFVQLSEDRRKTGTLGFFVYPAQWCLDTVQLVFTVFGDVNSVRVYYACFFFFLCLSFLKLRRVLVYSFSLLFLLHLAEGIYVTSFHSWTKEVFSIITFSGSCKEKEMFKG